MEPLNYRSIQKTTPQPSAMASKPAKPKWTAARWVGLGLVMVAIGLPLLQVVNPDFEQFLWEIFLTIVLAGIGSALAFPTDLRRTPRPLVICPHCQTAGHVSTRSVVRQTGVSGSKLSAAFITAGLSILFAGLARRERKTNAKCDRCGCEWEF